MGTDRWATLCVSGALSLLVIAACSGHQTSNPGNGAVAGQQPMSSPTAGAGNAASSTGGAPTSSAGSSPTSSGGAPTSVGSSGAAPASGGASSEPPLVVDPVATWGGIPLDMIPYASSGTRLEAIGYADEGAVFFDTMHDEHLSADCVYEQTEAGDWVCAPTLQRSLIYLDADCTQPAVEEQP